MKSIQEKAKIWNHGRTVDGKNPYYRTGEVAKICGFKSPKHAAKLIDKGVIRGRLINGRYGTSCRSYRVVSYRALVEYIERHENITARKWLLAQRVEAFENVLSREAGILAGFGGLPDCLRRVVKNLDPVDEMAGASADRRRIEIFQQMISLMDWHIKLRVLIAKSRQGRKK